MKRLAKAISESGIASRREAERLIASGQVAVDGETILTPVFFVNDSNIIEVNGERIQNRSDNVRIWRFYKPRGVVTTKRDPQGRKTVFDLINIEDERLLYIGRLDLNSEGLLLFTNNGKVSRFFELPSSRIKRTYKVRAFGKITDSVLKKIASGVTIDGIRYGSIDVRVVSSKSSNVWLTMSLYEGKNREIRNILSYFDIEVSRLIRVSYGQFSLGDLQPGEISYVKDLGDLLKDLEDI